ncbi:methyltransferase domain-containing protein [Streptomyces sp. NPDC046805]|uniref:class I SAM-dependent methyltransferase n=1 Tax=Streptomyces sp. NPDC046805 TaxID=3155134 RepID=UPI0033FEB58C
MSDVDWARVFDRSFTEQSRSTRQRVWREVYGQDYAEHAEPYSYVSRSELEEFAEHLQIGQSGAFVDLGCGRGGPGLVVALRTGARLIGLDISEVALADAEQAAQKFGLTERVEFRRGGFAATGLTDRCVHAVMSVDALTFALDKQQALTEMARILAPGGRLVFTSWDYKRTPDNRPPQVQDHRPLLERAGFQVLGYKETTDWRHRWQATSHGMITRRAELVEELGEERAVAMIAELQRQLDNQLPLVTRRILAIATRQ